jgi:hypothetical protein
MAQRSLTAAPAGVTATPPAGPLYGVLARWQQSLQDLGMDSAGHLARPLECTRCRQPLRAEHGETHAGRFNGLCQRCTKSGAYLDAVAADGCQRWSFPPHLPSWRRDREFFRGYADCADCAGRGIAPEPGRDISGGRYPVQCKACSDRYAAHPSRRWADGWRTLIATAAQVEYDRQLDELARKNLPPRPGARAVRQMREQLIAEGEHAAIKAHLQARYQQILTIHRRHCDRLGIYSWRTAPPPAPPGGGA